jgi:hypothetical protein
MCFDQVTASDMVITATSLFIVDDEYPGWIVTLATARSTYGSGSTFL